MSSARRSAKRPPLSPPVREAAGATMLIDAATRANLELMRTLSGERRGSLLAAIDRTVTAAGSRLLAQRLAAPAHRSRRDRRAARCGRVLRRRRAPRAATCASALKRGARHRARAGAAVARTRRPARSRRDARRARRRRGAAPRLRAARRRCRRRSRRRRESLRRPDPAIARRARSARSPTNCRYLKRDGGFVRAGYDAALDETRALRDESPPRDRRAAGALCRRRPASAR